MHMQTNLHRRKAKERERFYKDQYTTCISRRIQKDVMFVCYACACISNI